MDLREIGCESMDWTHLDQDSDQWQDHEHGNETSGSMKGGQGFYSLKLAMVWWTGFIWLRTGTSGRLLQTQ